MAENNEEKQSAENSGAKDDSAQLTQALLNRAKNGKHSEFMLIRSPKEYAMSMSYLKSTRHVYKKFKGLKSKMYDKYCKKTMACIDDLELILTIKNLENVVDFYGEECRIVKDCQAEYRTYVRCGHRLDVLAGVYRPDSDMVDYRKLPWSLF